MGMLGIMLRSSDGSNEAGSAVALADGIALGTEAG